MAVLVRAALGMSTEQYEEVSKGLEPQVRQAPGFVAHVGYVEDDGVHIYEVWNSREQYDRWFEEAIRPNFPADAAGNMDVLEVIKLVLP